jgi:hypothetical protein
MYLPEMYPLVRSVDASDRPLEGGVPGGAKWVAGTIGTGYLTPWFALAR